MLCIDVRNFLKKSIILKKECTGMFPTLAIIETIEKGSIWWKTVLPLAFGEPGSAPDIYWKLPYQRMRNLHYQCTQCHAELVFSFFCSCFSVFLLFCLCLYFFLFWILWNTKKRNVNKFACYWLVFIFRAQEDVSNRKWNFTSLATRASARMNWLMSP